MMMMPTIENVPWRYSSPSHEVAFYKGQNEPVAVVLHRMQGYATTARRWAADGHYGASWHYTVGLDGSIMQHLSHEDGGYHAGILDTEPSPTWPLWRGHGQNVNHYCVTPNTPILTPDLRWVLAGDLREGDGLLGFDELPAGEGRRRRLQDASVVRTGFQKKPVYRVLLRNGDELLSTAEHRWLVRGGQRSGTAIHWMETLDIARAMASGRTIAMPKYFPVKNTVDSYAAGFLAAAFDGEGHLVKHQGGQVFHLGYSQKNNAMAARVHEYLSAMDFAYRVNQQSGQSTVYTTTLRNGRTGVYEFLMAMRPPRLIDRWLAMDKQDFALSARSHQTVQSVEFVGEQEIVELGSSSLTYIANGYGAHNTIGIECEGFEGDEWPAAQLESLRWLCRLLARELGIPYDRDHFPPHAEIDVVNRVNDFDRPERRHIVYDYLFAEAEMDPRLDAVIAALGGMDAIEAWNARGNSLLAGYALEQEKLGTHLGTPHGSGTAIATERIGEALTHGAKAAAGYLANAAQKDNGG